ncbi:hypothetical protein N9W84_00305 [bacterium]|nr:hypothetical protein [bacterium]
MKKKGEGLYQEERKNILSMDAEESILKQLIFLGSAESSVEIGGHTFVLKTLSEEEYRDLVIKVLLLPDSGKIASARSISISASLKTINGVDFGSLVKSEMESAGKEVSENSLEKEKVGVILRLQSSVISRLYSEFEQLNQKSLEEIKVEEVKK